MTDLFQELVELQKQTAGATFIMGFSIKSNKYYISFNNKHKRFEAFEPDTVLIMAIEWVREMRREHPLEQKYTLFNYYNTHRQ